MQTTHTRTKWIILLSLLLINSVFTTPTWAQCGAMDVAFVIDDTSSLQGSLNNIKAELNNILNDIEKASSNDYRLSLVTFKDNVTVRVQFSDRNRAEITSQILALSAAG
ncbi:MAG TPA: vWA domain-containing protein, partial [Blastocatellia bacterium]|nr:vWA domain-containing protein [Blastocatellia bacterium]